MKVSVVMAVRNAEAYLAEAVESVLAQTLSNWELVIVDDCSEDGTAAQLDAYARQDARVRVLHADTMGQGQARQRALALCQADYVANLDADDAMLPERLERQAQFLDEHPHVGLLGSAAELMDEDGRTYCTYVWPSTDPELRRLLQRDNPFFHSAVMLRTAMLREVGGYDPRFLVAEDYDLWVRVAQHCRLASLPMALIRYRTHAQSLSRTRHRVAAQEVLLIQWRAIVRGWHGPWTFVFTVRPLFYLLAPQSVVSFLYRRRRRRNRGVVVRTASWRPPRRLPVY